MPDPVTIPTPDLSEWPLPYVVLLEQAIASHYGAILTQAAAGDLPYDQRRPAAMTVAYCGHLIAAVGDALGKDVPPLESYIQLATLIDAGKTDDLRMILAEPLEDDDVPQGF